MALSQAHFPNKNSLHRPMDGVLQVVMDDRHPPALSWRPVMFFIGSTPDRSGTLLSLGLARFQAILTPKDFKTIAQQTGRAPKKGRPLTPQVVFWLMACVGLHTESMTQGLLRAWDWVRAACPHLPADCVSEEAFCQARRQLPLRFWRALWDCLQARYQHRFSARRLTAGVTVPTCPKS